MITLTFCQLRGECDILNPVRPGDHHQTEGIFMLLANAINHWVIQPRSNG